MAESPFVRRMRQTMRDVGSRAVDEILGAQSSGDALGAAVRTVQQGRRLLDAQSTKVLSSLGLATHDDVDRLSQRLGRIRKRLERLAHEI